MEACVTEGRQMDAATKAIQTVAEKRAALATAKLELEEAVVEASAAGMALRPIACQAGLSHETVMTIVRNAVWSARRLGVRAVSLAQTASDGIEPAEVARDPLPVVEIRHPVLPRDADPAPEPQVRLEDHAALRIVWADDKPAAFAAIVAGRDGREGHLQEAYGSDA